MILECLRMASLHKDPRGRSPYWYCAYTLPNGRRCLKSTKQTDRKKASDICRAWEKAAEAAGRGHLTTVQATKVLNEILESVGESPILQKSVRDFCLNWLTGKQQAKKETTGRRYKKAVQEFLDSLGARADKPLSALTPADIEHFRDARTEQGVSAATVKLDLKLVRSVLNTARRQAFILHNPAEAIDLPLVKSHERDVFTLSDVRALLTIASPDWKTAILVGYYIGPRLGDVVSLTWSNVDLAEGVIFYTQGKTGGKKVVVPIHPDLEEHLLKIAGDNPTGFLCPSLGSVNISGRSGLSKQFAALMAEAGIDQRQIQSSRNHKFSQLSFHSLRHSFSSALANLGISADVRMKLTGHKSVDVHGRYTHMQLEPLKKAIQSLPRL
jgi:integrase